MLLALMVVVVAAEPARSLENLVHQVREAAEVRPPLRFDDPLDDDLLLLVKPTLRFGVKAKPAMLSLLSGNWRSRRFAVEVLRQLAGVTREDLPTLMEAYSRFAPRLLPAITQFHLPEVLAFLVREETESQSFKDPQRLAAIAGFGEAGARAVLEALKAGTHAENACDALTLMKREAGVIEAELVALADRAKTIDEAWGPLTLLSCIEPLGVSTTTIEALANRFPRYRASQRVLVRARSEEGQRQVREAIANGAFLEPLLGGLGAAAKVFEPDVIALLPEVSAAEMLGELATERGIAALTSFLTDQTDWQLPCVAAESLVQARAPRALAQHIPRTHWYPPTAECLTDAAAALRGERQQLARRRFFDMPSRDRVTLPPPALADPAQLSKRELVGRAVTVPGDDQPLPATTGRRFRAGVLLGADNGEFGGAVAFVDDQGERVVFEGNVFRVVEFGGTAVIVSGCAHLGLDEGSLYRLVEVDGRLQAKWWRRLPSAPRDAFVAVSNELFVSCAAGDVLISADGTMRLAIDVPHE